MRREPLQDDSFVRRTDDVKLKLPFGIEINANGRSVILVLIALALIGLLAWHHVTSDASNQSIHEAVWFQTLILAAPQEARPLLLRQGATKAPQSVKDKIYEVVR